jgi:hypothetical protein
VNTVITNDPVSRRFKLRSIGIPFTHDTIRMMGICS